jgi:hypothetical protein
VDLGSEPVEELPYPLPIAHEGDDPAPATAGACQEVDPVRALVKLSPRQILRPRARRLDYRQDRGELVGILGRKGAVQYPAQVRGKGRQGQFHLPVIMGVAVGI